ncbi:MAG: SMC-Scp complex subunit ScpB [Candidatus Heimdallarchaeota archaeon]
MSEERENLKENDNIFSEGDSIEEPDNIAKEKLDANNQSPDDIQEENEQQFDETIKEQKNISLIEIMKQGEISQKIDEETTDVQMKDLQKNLIEGALYAAGRPLDVEEISTKLEISKKLVEELVIEVAYDYLERSSALIIAQIGDKFQMQIRPEYTEKVSKFAKGGAIAERYLRTLTIIALKQPILKSTVVKLRGSGAYEHIKYLLDNDLISAVKKGRTHELTTTDKYADMFGLPKSKEELRKTMITQLGLENNQK